MPKFYTISNKPTSLWCKCVRCVAQGYTVMCLFYDLFSKSSMEFLGMSLLQCAEFWEMLRLGLASEDTIVQKVLCLCSL